jgi:hypothetical protein
MVEIPARMLKTRMRQTWRESPAGLNSQIFSTSRLLNKSLATPAGP